MVIKNIYMRSFFGLFSILLGSALIKIYMDRDKDTVWGELYRMGEGVPQGSKGGILTGKIYLILGVLGIVSGLIALLYGFRMVMVGT